jgi:hypothetical protein
MQERFQALKEWLSMYSFRDVTEFYADEDYAGHIILTVWRGKTCDKFNVTEGKEEKQ